MLIIDCSLSLFEKADYLSITAVKKSREKGNTQL
jgi:hypothetical protein